MASPHGPLAAGPEPPVGGRVPPIHHHPMNRLGFPRDLDTGSCRDLMQRRRCDGLFVVGVPAVGTSSPDRIVSSLDLPDPEAPTRAISSPRSTTRSKPCRATTSTPSALKVRTSPSQTMWPRSLSAPPARAAARGRAHSCQGGEFRGRPRPPRYEGWSPAACPWSPGPRSTTTSSRPRAPPGPAVEQVPSRHATEDGHTDTCPSRGPRGQPPHRVHRRSVVTVAAAPRPRGYPPAVGAGVRPDPVPRSCGPVGCLDRQLAALLWY